MTCTQLQQLSKPELIEIILRQQALIEQFQARVADLDEQLDRFTGARKDCTNSSIPPSQSPTSNGYGCQSNEKRGPKQGHEGRSRRPQACRQLIRSIQESIGDQYGGHGSLVFGPYQSPSLVSWASDIRQL